jgi:hypothetical protein
MSIQPVLLNDRWLTARVTCWRAGLDSPSKRKELEARQMLEKRARREAAVPAARTGLHAVSGAFLLCKHILIPDIDFTCLGGMTPFSF